jgi:ribosome-binding factor A
MANGSRPDRVGDLIRSELSVQLTRHVRDPGVRNVTITHVRMSKNLQQAQVFYTGPNDDTGRLNTTRALRRAKPFLKRQLGHQLQLRHVPELRFEYDDTVAQQDHMARLFEQISQDPPVNAEPSEPEP